MENDLISRSAILEELSKGTIITDDYYGMGIMEGNDHAMRKIAAAPAVDMDFAKAENGGLMMPRLIDANKYKEDLWVGHEYLDEDTLLTATNIELNDANVDAANAAYERAKGDSHG